jgi:oxalate decarboxylase/phosphoglucose isomerase-like protein (cupin superfamily)
VRDTRVTSAREIAFFQHERDGVLTVYPAADPAGVPFPIARLFTLGGVAAGGTRGHHAHRACSQLLACLAGRAELAIDDGREQRRFVLEHPARGVLVPPGLWMVVTFAGPGTLVAVFCDRPFEESDYLRERAEFLREKGLPGEGSGAR